MSGPQPEGQLEEFRAVVTFSVGPEADPAWRDSVEEILAGLGNVAGLGIVSVELDPVVESSELHPSNPALRMTIEEFFPAPGPDEPRDLVRLRRINRLREQNLETVGDLLAAGKYRVEDIKNLGDKTVSTIDTLLGDMGFTWENNPGVMYMTKIYKRPADAPLSLVVGRVVSKLERVGEVMPMEREELAHTLRRVPFGSTEPEPDYATADEVLREVKVFVTVFDLIKARS